MPLLRIIGLNPCCNGRGSKTSHETSGSVRLKVVLILVVMEEGQRPRLHEDQGRRLCLNPCCNGRGSKTGDRPMNQGESWAVLILVVMEEGQRRRVKMLNSSAPSCLNPCCNGRGSKTQQGLVQVDETLRRLNPCCNGRGLKSPATIDGRRGQSCLSPCCNGRGSKTMTTSD